MFASRQHMRFVADDELPVNARSLFTRSQASVSVAVLFSIIFFFTQCDRNVLYLIKARLVHSNKVGNERQPVVWQRGEASRKSSPLMFITNDRLAASQQFRSLNNSYLRKSRPTACSSGSQFAERALRSHPLPHLEDVFTAYTAIKASHLFSVHEKKALRNEECTCMRACFPILMGTKCHPNDANIRQF